MAPTAALTDSPAAALIAAPMEDPAPAASTAVPTAAPSAADLLAAVKVETNAENARQLASALPEDKARAAERATGLKKDSTGGA